MENVEWAVRRGEVNDYYYLYGLHKRGAPPADSFLAVREMMNLITDQVRDSESQRVFGVLKDKYLFSLVAQALGHRSPRVLALLSPDGVEWLSPRWACSYGELAAGGETDGFVKPLGGRQAAGAFALRIKHGRVLIDSREATPDEVRARVSERSVLQERIVQHPALTALHAPSINTVRLVTVLRDGEARPLAAALRIGVGGRSVDNWSAGGLIAGVDLATGRLYGQGLFKPERRGGLRRPAVDQHPDSSVLLDGYALPSFAEGVGLACRFHRDLMRPTSVGWDLAFTPSGPTVVEGNTYWNGAMFMALDTGFKARYLAAVDGL